MEIFNKKSTYAGCNLVAPVYLGEVKRPDCLWCNFPRPHPTKLELGQPGERTTREMVVRAQELTDDVYEVERLQYEYGHIRKIWKLFYVVC